MMPVFFRYGSIELSSYALMLSIGACVGFWLTAREITRKGLDPGRMLGLASVAFVGGVIGARGLSYLLHRSLYVERPWWSIFAVGDRGGMSMYGGLALAVVLGLVWIRLRRMPAWEASDTLVVAWVPFLVFVRVGCFLNGCCYGRPTTGPFGMVAGGAPNNVSFGIPSHPTQLYAAAAALAIFSILWRLRTRRRYAGQPTVTFLGIYSAFVFFHEFLRGDITTAWRFGGLGVLTFNQIASVAVFTLAVATAWRLSARNGGGVSDRA